MDNSKPKDNSGWWGLAIIVGLVVLSQVFQPKSSPQVEPASTTGSYVNCQIASECGGGTRQLSSSACSQLSCCQVGSEWILKSTKAECQNAQQAYNLNLVNQKYNTYVPLNATNGVNTAPTKTCCKVCTTGKPCGDTCISRNKTCHVVQDVHAILNNTQPYQFGQILCGIVFAALERPAC